MLRISEKSGLMSAVACGFVDGKDLTRKSWGVREHEVIAVIGNCFPSVYDQPRPLCMVYFLLEMNRK